MLIEQTARTGIMFQLTAARRRLPVEVSIFTTVFTFQLTAARRRLPLALAKVIEQEGFNSQPPEGGCARENLGRVGNAAVSTHSRPKAAALTEGKAHVYGHVSTHSRPKAAATSAPSTWSKWQSFNSQPPEGGCGRAKNHPRRLQRFNSQPPEGGCCLIIKMPRIIGVSTHSRPKAAAWCVNANDYRLTFQLTATRRRLPDT